MCTASMLFWVPASSVLAVNLASVMKGPQTFDALLDQQIGETYDAKPPVNLDAERMDMHELDEQTEPRRVPSVLPRSASYEERLFEWRMHRAGW